MLVIPFPRFRHFAAVVATMLATGFAASGASASIILALSFANPHPDGSYVTRAESYEEIAKELATAYLTRKTDHVYEGIPHRMKVPLTLEPGVDNVNYRFSNGFLDVGFQTRYTVELQEPLLIDSREDLDTLIPLLALATHDGVWSVRFFQSPETSRWHIISDEAPEATALSPEEEIHIRNVNRHTFRVRTSGPEAPLLGDLVFSHYSSQYIHSLEDERGLPLQLDRQPGDYGLTRITGTQDEVVGDYRLTTTTGPAQWDESQFPWVASPRDFALAAALVTPGTLKWNFPVVRLDEHSWRISSDSWLEATAPGMEIMAVEETGIEYANRMQEAARSRVDELVAKQRESRRTEEILEKDAAARRLHLARTDGVAMSRVLLHGQQKGAPVGERVIGASLETNSSHPLTFDPLLDVDWLNSPIREVREIGEADDLTRFELTVEALPPQRVLPLEMWASFYFDEITVERLLISSEHAGVENLMEAGFHGEGEGGLTLYCSTRGHNKAIELAELSRPRADQDILRRIGEGLRYRRSPEGPPEMRGPVPGQSPNTRPTAPNRVTGFGGCSGSGCGTLEPGSEGVGTIRFTGFGPTKFLLVLPPPTPENPAAP